MHKQIVILMKQTPLLPGFIHNDRKPDFYIVSIQLPFVQFPFPEQSLGQSREEMTSTKNRPSVDALM